MKYLLLSLSVIAFSSCTPLALIGLLVEQDTTVPAEGTQHSDLPEVNVEPLALHDAQ